MGRQRRKPSVLSVLLVHDQELVRAGLRALIEQAEDLEVVAEAADVPGAMRRARGQKPSLILLAPRGGNRAMLRAVPDLIEASGGAVVALGENDDPGLLRAVLAAGVEGFLVPTASVAELHTALRRVSDGEGYVHPAAGARFARAERRAKAAGERLTTREEQIIGLLALGKINREIAGELRISMRTVEWHRQRIQHKLGLLSRSSLTRFAIASGLVGDLAPAKRGG